MVIKIKSMYQISDWSVVRKGIKFQFSKFDQNKQPGLAKQNLMHD